MFNKRVFHACAATLMLAPALLGWNPANAAVIYSSFGDDDSFPFLLSSGWTIGGPVGLVQGLQFTPAQSDVVQTIEIAAFWIAGGTALNVSLMTDTGNLPGTVIETLPVCCFVEPGSIQMANSVLRPPLTGGTKYWLLVSPVAAGDHFGWCRNFEAPLALNAQRFVGGSWSIGFEWQGAVRISGEASTPTSSASWGRLKSLYR